MTTNDKQQPREINNGEVGTSLRDLQLAVTLSNHSLVQVLSSSSGDGSSSSEGEDEDDGNQVAELREQASTDNANKIINTYNDCTNISSTVNNTTIYEDEVTVIHNVYCCSASLDYVRKWRAAKRGLFIFIASLLGILLIILLSLWLTTSSTTTTDVLTSSSTESLNRSAGKNLDHEWIIINRQDWKAAPATKPPMKLEYLPPWYIIFSETETETCTSTPKCMEIVRNIQASQMNDGMDDIAYNFLIGGDGMVYEGRGWDVAGDVKNYDTEKFDDVSISVSFIGKYDNDAPTEIILQAAKTFLKFGSQIEKLPASPKLKCVRQLSFPLRNPGDKLYEILETWKGWDFRTIESNPLWERWS